MLSRRDLLATIGVSLATGVVGCSSDAPHVPSLPDAAEPTDGGPFLEEVDFFHGVASGDPLSDRVILWTRVTPRGDVRGSVDVRWEVSNALDFATLVTSGNVVTNAARDYTVKVDATTLTPGTTYYYRFAVGTTRSLVGRTRTTPVGSVDRLRLAVVSCASLAHGYFHIYRDLAERLDLDAVVHLGDYIYEYPTGLYGNVRPYDPPTMTVSLSDYRRRHAHYRRDPDLRAVHQQHPVIAIWDDHESANNASMSGAESHVPATQGAWRDRRDAAVRAYFEWMPVREQPDGRIWRRFSFGDLADLVMLDTRLWARPMQLPRGSPGINDPRRTLLGDDQERWLLESLGTSTARWKIVGQQVRMAALAPKYNADAWEGYPAARDRFLQALSRMRTRDVAVLTGDIHTSWAWDLALDPFDRRAYDPRTGVGSIAVEFTTPGVSSPGQPPEAEADIPGLLRDNPHLRYGNASKRGFVLLDVTPERLQSEWFHLPYGSVEQRERRRPTFSTAWLTRAGANHLTPGGDPTQPRDNPPAAAPWEPV